MACRIHRNPVTNKIVDITLADGTSSRLFRELLEVVPSNPELYYAYTLTPEFKKIKGLKVDENNEPILFTDKQTNKSWYIAETNNGFLGYNAIVLSNTSIEDKKPTKLDIYTVSKLFPTIVTAPFKVIATNYSNTYISDSLKNQYKDFQRNPDTNEYENGAVKFQSVTGHVLPSMETKQYLLGPSDPKTKLSVGQRKAEILWRNLDPTVKLKTKESEFPIDKETFAVLYDSKVELFIAKGNILHKLIHYHFSKDESIKREVDAIVDKFGLSKGEIAWMNEQTILALLHRAGTDYVYPSRSRGELVYKVNPDHVDKITTEMIVGSNILNVMGSVDLVIDHGNNILSFKDIKTGAALDRMWENEMFLYGTTPSTDIFVNPRNKGKLQLMWYMVLTKIHNPEVKFRDSEILHIPNFNYVTKVDNKSHINVEDYLYMIENYLKDKQPTAYTQIMELPHAKSIFDPTTYNAHDAKSVNLDVSDNDVAKQLRMKMLELQSLVLYDKDLEVKARKGYGNESAIYEKIQKLMKEIIDLKGQAKVDYSSWDTDMSWMDTWLGSMSASTNPYVQLYYKVLSEAKQEANEASAVWETQLHSWIKRLMRDAGMSNWKLGLGSLIGGVDREKLFGFVYKQYNYGGNVRTRFLNPELAEDKAEYDKLTDTQKKFLEFVLDTIDQYFIDEKSNWIDPWTGKKVALANKIATTRNYGEKEVKITNLDLARGSGRVSSDLFEENGGKYYRGWMPKYAPQLDDIARDNKWYSPKVLQYLWNRYTTNYYEAFYDGWYQTEEVIPLKYLGSAEIDNNQNYTTNLPLLLTNFVQQYNYKLHLDNVYAFGNGLKMYLKAKEEKDSNISFKNTIDWFEDSINIHILGHKQDSIQLTRREFRRRDLDGFKRFNFVKFIRSLKKFFGMATMGLKPIGGTLNFLFASMVSTKEALRNEIGSTHHFRYGVKDLKEAFGVATQAIISDGMTGKWTENKVMSLMRKYRWLPDNFDWYTNANQLLTAKNKIFSSSTMYAFYTLPEEVIATTLFIAQMKAIKLEDGSTLWDHYKPVTKLDQYGNEYTDYEYDGTVRGKINTSTVEGVPQYQDLLELSVDELNAMKFTYEKIHGGYRLDERVRAEYYILGEVALQFKKYFPSILKNIGASRGNRVTQGYYEKLEENGVTTMRWVPQVIEGRWRLLAGVILHYLGLRSQHSYPSGAPRKGWQNWLKLQTNESYAWDKLSDIQKEDIQDTIITFSTFMTMFFAGLAGWDRKEKDSLKRMFDRIRNDFAGNIWPGEVLYNMYNLRDPVVFAKSYKFITSFSELVLSGIMYTAGYPEEAFTEQGNLRGQREFERTVPILSAKADLVRFFSETDAIEGPDWLENRVK